MVTILFCVLAGKMLTAQTLSRHLKDSFITATMERFYEERSWQYKEKKLPVIFFVREDTGYHLPTALEKRFVLLRTNNELPDLLATHPFDGKAAYWNVRIFAEADTAEVTIGVVRAFLNPPGFEKKISGRALCGDYNINRFIFNSELNVWCWKSKEQLNYEDELIFFGAALPTIFEP
jgi:hypothetical protein